MRAIHFIILSALFLLSCQNNKHLPENGIYVIHSERDVFISKSDNGIKVFLDEMSMKNLRDIKTSFYPNDSIGFENAIQEILVRKKENRKYIGIYSCKNIVDTNKIYYVVLFSDYKNRWYEREN